MRALIFAAGLFVGGALAFLLVDYSMRGAVVLRGCERGGTGYDPETSQIFEGYDCDGAVVLRPTGKTMSKGMVPGQEL